MYKLPQFLLLSLVLIGIGTIALRYSGKIDSDKTIDPEHSGDQTANRSDNAATIKQPKVEMRKNSSKGGFEENKIGAVSFNILERENSDSEREHSHSLGTWSVSIEPSPSEWRLFEILNFEPALVFLETPDGETHELLISRAHEFGPNKGVYSGTVSDSPFSSAMFSYVGAAIVGNLRFPDRGISWEIRNQGDGTQIIEKVDLETLKHCATCRDE